MHLLVISFGFHLQFLPLIRIHFHSTISHRTIWNGHMCTLEEQEPHERSNDPYAWGHLWLCACKTSKPTRKRNMIINYLCDLVRCEPGLVSGSTTARLDLPESNSCTQTKEVHTHLHAPACFSESDPSILCVTPTFMDLKMKVWESNRTDVRMRSKRVAVMQWCLRLVVFCSCLKHFSGACHLRIPNIDANVWCDWCRCRGKARKDTEPDW